MLCFSFVTGELPLDEWKIIQKMSVQNSQSQLNSISYYRTKFLQILIA